MPDQFAHLREAGVLLQIGSAPDLIDSVCAPIRNATGRIVGAISVAAAAQYLGDETMRQIEPFVAETARAISTELGAVRTARGSRPAGCALADSR